MCVRVRVRVRDSIFDVEYVYSFICTVIELN